MTPAPAPIALTIIAYRRADKLHTLLQSLADFPASHVAIFCDGARGAADRADCLLTQEVARTHALLHPHVSVTVRESNLGLNENVIQSITTVLGSHPFTLVLEEDVIPTAGLAPFIQHYEPLLRQRTEVFSIAAYHPCAETIPQPGFLSRRFFCWGWATWANRWSAMLPLLRGTTWPYEHYWQVPDSIGSDLAWAHRRHRMGRRGITWARLLTLWTLRLGQLHFCPRTRLINNIGLDGSGEHCSGTDRALRLAAAAPGTEVPPGPLPDDLVPDPAITESIRRFFTNCPSGAWRKRLHYEIIRRSVGLRGHGLSGG